jgi:hypothetical protein
MLFQMSEGGGLLSLPFKYKNRPKQTGLLWSVFLKRTFIVGKAKALNRNSIRPESL